MNAHVSTYVVPISMTIREVYTIGADAMMLLVHLHGKRWVETKKQEKIFGGLRAIDLSPTARFEVNWEHLKAGGKSTQLLLCARLD